jgi:protein subunit release factor A
MATETTATGFAKSFGLFAEAVQREPVALTGYTRISGNIVSAHEYRELQRLREFERWVHRLKRLPDELAATISESRMAADPEHLNALLED